MIYPVATTVDFKLWIRDQVLQVFLTALFDWVLLGIIRLDKKLGATGF
jgi:hypothetical protein